MANNEPNVSYQYRDINHRSLFALLQHYVVRVFGTGIHLGKQTSNRLYNLRFSGIPHSVRAIEHTFDCNGHNRGGLPAGLPYSGQRSNLLDYVWPGIHFGSRMAHCDPIGLSLPATVAVLCEDAQDPVVPFIYAIHLVHPGLLLCVRNSLSQRQGVPAHSLSARLLRGCGSSLALP